MDIRACTAIVSGAASGLGLATATKLASGGARVVAIDLEASAALTQLGGRVHFVAADVTDDEAVKDAVDLANLEGSLRIAVNCAGIVGRTRRTVGKEGLFPLDEFSRVLNVNLVGCFNVLRHCAGAMASNGVVGEERGVIVNTASIAGFDGQIGQAAYAASKAGIIGMTLPIARDLAELRIRVMTIAPGLFQTPILDFVPEDLRKDLAAQAPHPARLGVPDEFAALVRAIIENPMLNGETIRLDGAIRMGPR